ncbi:uncharacterized protein LOC115415166 [Sphaeramia orbicularis]|uniref:uncharacterized protein LOC115415166 n=1 Tax=Sphaeramia orbicularis TaxID=375764 RepID=UPI00117DFC07|nr:uncharacterized protein LOC115415166 [Sphaeramia orbicularis]XP_029984513.1 uncharacterized protein LOC115415166 [Sphaeramia orbicularis]XP_029984514.1 uncharacterized protein LOC115415166 [Sphaeramia orbicularis]
MDGDTCNMMDKKMMDPSTLWQWRIRHVKKHSKCSDPFNHSHVIGVDFDVGSNKGRKVDLKLVTNGVIIEICDFAKTVTRGKKHFIANILENNFDLGLENEQQRVDFTNELAYRVEDLLRKPSTDKHEVFTLFDTPDCDGNNKNGLNMEGLSEEMGEVHVEDIKHQTRVQCSEEHSDDLQEDVLVSMFPYCDKIGLNFGIETKQNLDQGLLTKGVMLEVAHLAKVLCGSYGAIILKVLEHNFEVDLRGQEEKNQVLFSITALTKRTKRLMVSINQVISTFRNEQFPFHTMVQGCDLFNNDAQQSHLDEVTKRTLELNSKKQKRSLEDTDESVSKRCRREQSEHMVPHHADLDTFQISDGDSLTWLLEEYNRDIKREMDSNNAEDQDVCKEIFGKSESSCDNIQNPFLTTGNSCSRLPSGSPPLASYLNEMKQCVAQELTHTSTNMHNVWDMGKKNIETTVSTKHEEKALLVSDEPVSKRRRREQSGHRDHHGTDVGSCQITPADYSYISPLTEPDLDSDGETDSWNVDSQDEKDLVNSLSPEVPKESESSCADFHRPFLSTTDSPSNSSSVNAPPGGYTDDKKSNEGCEQTHRLRNIYNGCDIDQEEIKTEDNLWKMRGNRVKHILCNEEYCLFTYSRKAGVDYNVGFGPKQNLSIDCLCMSSVLEAAKFAIAMNCSQQDFIMEIFEHNFDLHLENDSDRRAFAYETMNRLRQLRNSDTMSKFSKETFELPLPNASVKQANKNTSSTSVVLSSASIEEEYSSQECSQNSHPEAKVIVSEENMDPYPYCKEIGLKLCVNKSQPVKLDVNTLTNGAICEVANFADKLCGTFEQIFLDVFKHNFDLDNQSYHSDLAKNIFMQIPLIVELKNLTVCRMKKTINLRLVDRLIDPRLQYQNSTNVDVCTSGSSQAPAVNQNVSGSAEIELQNEPSKDKELWKLRANKVKQILSMPHDEHCPLYSYSRCKKIGMDFNIGSGVKQNLDAKLLTNGIMVALNTFAEALHRATDYFITEILEYNFHLDLKSEQYRRAFELKTIKNVRTIKSKRKKLYGFRSKMLFELPDVKCLKIYHAKSTFCPKCYQNRNQKPGKDASVPGSMHTQPYAMIETASADSSSQRLFVSPAVEKAIMDCYPYCKEIGLSLCVNKNKPREKLSEHVLTRRVVDEVYKFATKLCGASKNKIIDDIIEHNFNISAEMNLAHQFSTKLSLYDGRLGWLNEVSVFKPVSQKDAQTPKRVTHERKKTKERPMALQNKMESATTNICNGCDMEPEEIETEDNMWKMRAKRVKNILSEMAREFWDFTMSRITNLELNIGFGAKKNFSFDCLTNTLILEVAKFVIAMNSSQQDFIMEILENNFDLNLVNDSDRSAFACETMIRVRQLQNSEDIIQFSKELFELPLPMLSNHITNESMGSVSAELTTVSGKTECNSKDCSQDSHPEAKENVSEKSDNPYPFCKEIGLKMFVNRSQPVKLDVNTLTNGAMAEVANFAEKLCGTFEQIFLDVLRHNFNLESQNDYSDLVKNILLHIPLIVEQKSFSLFAKTFSSKMMHSKKPILPQLVSPSIDVDIFSSASSQTPAMNHNVGSSIETEQQNEPSEDKELWKLRADYVKQILSMPHEHHCPLYPYPRCKKIGMDFNLASGVKPNLDPKLLTNGLMVEINTFATVLQSAKQHFVTEILEYNFHLNLKNEEYRKSFG